MLLVPSSKGRPFSTSPSATYLDRDAVVDELRRIAVEAVRRDARIARVILFGSLAHGVPTPRSDADLIVLMRTAAPRRMDRIPDLLRLFVDSPLPVDLHPYTMEEWTAASTRGDALPRVAREHGIDLFP
jgi:predicted nucleotidyltransferase